MNLDTRNLNQADRTLHSLSQLIALTGTQWLPARVDDSHTNLIWNGQRHRLEGRPFAHNGQPVRLVIDTVAFALYFIDNQEHVSASFSPGNRTPADAMAWWKSQMQAWGISEIRGLNYQLDHDPIASQTVYNRALDLTGWGNWRTAANAALSTLTAWSGRESDISIWPHHFDTGVYYSMSDSNGQERAAIWAGYAIADSVCHEPYFYLSGYSSGQAIDFAGAPALTVGEWRNNPAWKGAILFLSAVTEPKAVDVFFRESYTWLNNTLD